MTDAAMLAAEVDAALRARERLRDRPPRAIAEALAAAGARWRLDPALGSELPAAMGLSPENVAAAVDIAAAALDIEAMSELVERELGAARMPGTSLVAHVLASNVPALAVPAIALGCLAGVAMLVKSGRADRGSAPAFRRALAAVDPDLAATVVTAYWPGGNETLERVALGRAALVVATGHDATVAALSRRVAAVRAHGERWSVAVIGPERTREAADAVAADVALHDQRGCLSPQVVLTAGEPAAFAEELVAALDRAALRLPPGPLATEERAAHAAWLGDAEWRGARVLRREGGTVVVGGAFGAGPGRRTVVVRPLSSLDELPAGMVECVGLGGAEIDVGKLARRGVSRVCAVGRMQQPPLAWPRGQHAPLRSLLGLESGPQIEVEAP